MRRVKNGTSELSSPAVLWKSKKVEPSRKKSRFRWIVKPGSDLYFVYTHNLVDDPLQDRFNTLDRRAASKVLYTHRF